MTDIVSSTNGDRATTTFFVMKSKLLTLCLGLAVIGCGGNAQPSADAAEKTSTSAPAGKSAASAIEKQVDTILGDLQSAIDSKRVKALSDFDPHFKKLEDLYEKHRKEKTREAAMPLMTVINLNIRFLERPERALPYLKRLAKDYAGTEFGKELAGNAKSLSEFIQQREQQLEQQMAAMHQQMVRQQEAEGIYVGKPFPDFERVDSNGKALKLSALQGKPVLVVFWASWCGPCMQEAPNIKSVFEKYKKHGLQVVGINKDGSAAAMERVVAGMEMSWPQHQDKDDSLSLKLAAPTLPTIYLIDSKGKLAGTGMDLRGPNLEKTVRKVLAL